MDEPSWFKVCPECSHSNPFDHDYCARCGKYIGGAVQETLTKPASPLRPEQDTLSFVPGQRFGRRYIIIEEIGRGGMGRVYKAQDQELNVDVALKMIKPELVSNPSVVRRFKKETLLTRSLTSENIIRIFDLGEAEGIKFIAMEYIKGQSLGQMIRAAGRLDVRTALAIARQACAGMSTAHQQGVVHLDLKPANILVDSWGKVRVADFGLAKSLETEDGTLTAAAVGTPAYLSPEAAAGRATDHRSDIYSLGIVLYEMVTGKRPFESKTAAGFLQQHIHDKPVTPSSLNPQVPAVLEKIILKCLAKDPAQRYQTAGDLLRALTEVPDKRQAVVQVRQRPGRRRSRVSWAAAGAAVLLLALFLGWHFLRSPSGKRISVAVMVFENKTGDANLEYLRQALPLQIIQALLPSRRVRVITGDMLVQILQELSLADKPAFSAGELQKVAEKAKAGYLLQGNFSKNGEIFQVETLLHAAKTWELKGSHRIESQGLQNLTGLVDTLIHGLKSDLQLSSRQIDSDINPKAGLITTSSHEAWKHYIEAKDLYNRRMFAASNEALEKAVALDPKFALAYWSMAENSIYQGRMDQAKEFLAKALSLKSRISPREQALIEGLQDSTFKDDPLDAAEQYRKLLKLYPDDIEGNLYLGSLYRNLEEWDLAEERFDKVLELTSLEEPPTVNLVYIAMAKGLYDKALNILESQKDKISKALYIKYAFNICLCRNEIDKALALLKDAEEGDDPSILFDKTIALILKGDLSLAQELLSELAASTDTSVQLDMRLIKAHLALQEGKYGEARACAEDGVETSRLYGQKILELRFLLLISYLDLRRDDWQSSCQRAKEARQVAVEAYSTEFQKQALFFESQAYLKSGQTDKFEASNAALRKLIEKTAVRRHRHYYYFLLGLSAQEKGLSGQALDYYEMALTLLPAQRNWLDEQARWFDIVAAADYQAGQFDKARQGYERIQALTVGRLQWGDIYALSFYWAGKACQKLGDRDKAKHNFQEFLRLWENADPGQPEKGDARKQLASLG
jgi:serine/threonine protein kinase/Tfp pilus assembly protein PilF